MMGHKKQYFWPKIKILKGNHAILRIRGVPVRQKLGMILENRLVQKLKLDFFFFTKNGLLNCSIFLACLSPEKVKEPQFKILRMFWMATCAGAQATGPFLTPLNLLQTLTIPSQILKT